MEQVELMSGSSRRFRSGHDAGPSPSGCHSWSRCDLWHDIKPAIDAEEHLATSTIGRVGMKDASVSVHVEHTDTRQFVDLRVRYLGEVVEDALLASGFRKGDVEIV